MLFKRNKTVYAFHRHDLTIATKIVPYYHKQERAREEKFCGNVVWHCRCDFSSETALGQTFLGSDAGEITWR